ncbi:MAG: hypothetical protein FD187_3205, partial [bacterium]
ALIGVFVVLGLGTTLGEPEGVPDLSQALGLLTKVLVGQRLWADSSRAVRGPQMISEGVRGSWS